MSWPLAKLSDVCEINIGRTPARANSNYWGKGSPWLSIADMNQGRDLYNTKEQITDLGIKESNIKVVPKGTVLFSFKLSIGKIGITQREMYTNEAIAAFPIIDERILCENYLLYALTRIDATKTTDRAVMGATLNKRKLAELKIPLPPLEEQKRIAAILDKADAIRRKRQQAIELTDQLLRAVFLDMFGDPVTNPKGWDVVKGNELFNSLRYGTSQKCSDRPEQGSLPVLRIPNIVKETIDYSNLKYTALDKKVSDKIILKKGDILFVRTNGNPDYIGRCAVFNDDADVLYASYLIRGQIDNKYFSSADFVRFIVSFPTYRSKIEKEAKTTAGNYNINTQGLKNLEFYVPPIVMQNMYLGIAKNIAHNRHQMIKSENSSDDLFYSLTNQAFRGELTKQTKAA